MTHFVCGIIVPKEDVDCAEDYIDNTLEIYSENYEVEPYVEQTDKEMRDKFKKWEEDMEKKIKERAKLEDYEKKYIENGKLKNMTFKEWRNSWYGYGDEHFDKDGNLLTTSNPNSFFDYYSIGGRWDGLFYGKENPNGYGGELKDNLISIKDLIGKYKEKDEELRNPKDKVLRALSNEEDYNQFLISIVVADGKVHQSKKYGWWGTYTETEGDKEWKEKYLKLLEEHKDDFMINLDCHV